MKRVVKTGTERLLAAMRQHWTQPLAGKCVFDAEQLESIRAMAEELDLKDIEEDVPLTDAEILEQALTHVGCFIGNADRLQRCSEELNRLRAERDGVPLEVTEKLWEDWWYESRGKANMTAAMIARINAHHGVRPVPQVTAEMWGESYLVYRECNVSYSDAVKFAADYINAELAKQAGKGGG